MLLVTNNILSSSLYTAHWEHVVRCRCFIAYCLLCIACCVCTHMYVDLPVHVYIYIYILIIYIYIYILLILYIRHRARACEARVWRDRSCRRLNDSNGQQSMMPTMDGHSPILGLPDSPANYPFVCFEPLFSASNFDFKLGRLFKAPKSTQNRPKSSENRPPDPPKTYPKQHLILQCPKS